MATVTFWNNDDFGGDSDTYNGAQRRSYGTSKAWDSLKTGANTWLVVWDNSDYTGNYIKIDPNTQWYNDLNHAGRGSDGDWKNEIKSLIIYAHQPSWWHSTSTPPNNDLNLQAHDTVFCAATNFNDDTVVYTANVSVPDLNAVKFPTNSGRDMKNDFQSLATGSSAWLQIWNGTSYAGDSLRIYPGKHYPDLNNVPRIPSGDWKNQIQSFQLYDHKPDDSWNLGFDTNKFYGFFPDVGTSSDSDGPYCSYLTQDCPYQVRITSITFTSTTMTVNFRVDYTVLGKNDKANLGLTVNTDGTFNSASYEYEEGGAIQIPNAVIKAVDKTVGLLGLIGALETAGISEEMADSFLEVFDTFCEIFNKISGALYKISASNDGRFYLVPVCCHVLNRALLAVTVAN